MELFTYGILFLIGIFFGSFFTLAVYRIPKGENILYKHSYCPNCNHKLGILDLIPIVSYLFLGGKCRYCHEKVRIRYLLLEVLSGIVFVLYGYSIRFNIVLANTESILCFFFMFLYVAGLFIMAGIDKERKEIQTSVLWYEILVSIAYMIYICTLHRENAYIYVIYLSMLILAILLDTILLRKNAKPCYEIRIVILLLAMLMVNGLKILLFTIALTAILLLIYKIAKWWKQKRYKFIQKDNAKKVKMPIGFIICTFHIVSMLWINWLEHYIF